MLGLAARLLGGAVTPLVDQLSAASTRLARKIALFAVAGVCLLVTLIALTVAFDLWVSSLKGSIAGALAVAAAYFAVAVIAVAIALWPSGRRGKADRRATGRSGEEGADDRASAGHEAEVDDFAAPLLGLLQRLGLRREQLAVLAGTSLAKQIGPVPLVGLAILAGFLIGRLGKTLVSKDLVAALLASDLVGGLFRRDEPDENDDEPTRDAA